MPTAVPRIIPLVLPGAAGDTRAPVRIFVGTEPAQHRPWRVFCHALEQVRDRTRRYEVYRMSALPGFCTQTWRTGFTNYRFAIPALAGGSGRALYNDVDQVWTADPAPLFDAPLGGAGYLALSVQDTAVMLLDCARMARVWTWEAACRQDKKTLLAAAAPLWGPLAPRWHARDGEYRPGESALLHYTALHTQPWQPTPGQYSYHPHPHGELWLDLERRADAQGYEPYGAAQPSPEFAPACARLAAAEPPTPWPSAGARALADALGCTRLLTVGPATAPPWPGLAQELVGPAALRAPGGQTDIVAGLALETLDPDDLAWVISAMFARAGRLVLIHADLRGARAPADHADYWRALVRRIARAWPALCWRLELRDARGATLAFQADFAARATPPRVWLLAGRHAGDNAQLERLAEALGWPYEVHTLRFRPLLCRLPGWLVGARTPGIAGVQPPLAPPWPDLVLAAGRRSAPLARALAARGARSVLLGRPRAPLDAFDLVITTPQYGLPARANVMHLPAPLCAPPLPPDAALVERWRARLADLPRPWTLLLVGGPSRPYRFDAGTARAVAAATARALATRAGSVLVCGSPRTPAAALDALEGALDRPARVYRFRPADPDNPYRAWLALADACIVTGESASMLADAVATGAPVAVYPLPARRPWWRRAAGWLGARAGITGRGAGSRGTPRQQDRRGRWYDALVAAGLITRTRDLAAVHAALGVRPLPDGLDAPPQPGARALQGAHANASARVRELLSAEHPA